MFKRALMMVAVLVTTATSSFAQGADVPRVEIGARAGCLTIVVGCVPTYGGVLTLRIASRLALEGDLAVAPTLHLGGWSAKGGLFQVGLRGPIVASRRGVQWFWTAGAAGAFADSRVSGDPFRLFNLDLPIPSVARRHDRYVMPPVMPSAGTGFLVPFSAHAAVRADVRLLFTPLGPHAQGMVGVSVPVGRFGSRK